MTLSPLERTVDAARAVHIHLKLAKFLRFGLRGVANRTGFLNSLAILAGEFCYLVERTTTFEKFPRFAGELPFLRRRPLISSSAWRCQRTDGVNCFGVPVFAERLFRGRQQ